MKTLIRIGCLLLVGAMLGSCSSDPNKGYTTDPPFRKGIRTVYVPIWTLGKDVYTRGEELSITEEVKKRIDGYSLYSTRVDKGRADTELTGRLERISVQTLSMNTEINRPREQEVTFEVYFKWVDNRTGEVLKEMRGFRVSGRFYPLSPLSEDRFQGYQAAINVLAERVVEQMEIPFTRPKPSTQQDPNA
jgi:hypothetical protein